MAQECPDARPQGAKVLFLRSTLKWAPYDARRASTYASEPASPGTRRSPPRPSGQHHRDGHKQSEYCGGFTEVAKGFWLRRDDLDYGKLVDYAKRLDVGAVTRRLGFLLETFEVDAPRELERLQKTLTATYAILDPLLPEEGKFMARWRLRLNVDPDEIVSVVRT